MLIPFKELPDHSKIWIYQSDKKLTEGDIEWLKIQTNSFLTQWTAHGQALKAGFEVRYNRFIIIGLDEGVGNASGCSIDASVNFMTRIGQKLDIDFFNRSLIALLIDGNTYLEELNKIKSGKTVKEVKPSTIIFNNLVSNKGELESKWMISVSESWINRVITKVNT